MDPLEIDEPLPDIRANQSHAEPVADFDALEALGQ
jgi:hypothetical protein